MANLLVQHVQSFDVPGLELYQTLAVRQRSYRRWICAAAAVFLYEAARQRG